MTRRRTCPFLIVLVFLEVLTSAAGLRRPQFARTRVATDARRSAVVDYRGHAVLRTTPTNSSHLQLLASLQDVDASNHRHQHGANMSLDFWRPPTVVKRSVDMRLRPEDVRPVSAALTHAGLKVHVIADDLQRLLDDDRRSRPGQLTEAPQHVNMSTYHTYDTIMRWLDYICAARNMTHATCDTVVIGRSAEGRDLKVIKFGTSLTSKPIIWIDAGVHAREWIAPATALFLINKLLDRTDRVARQLISQYRWYVMPLANPDGYVYTWTTDRLWRKNRSRNPDPRIKCRGADLNRNWDFHWGGPGTSNKPCSEDYAGHHAFSEPETKAVADFLLMLQQRQRAPSNGRCGDGVEEGVSVYLSLHSYGQCWLTPWGFTYRLPPDYNDMLSVGSQAVEAIRRTHGKRYSLGTSSRLMYLASGGSDDWAKGVGGIPYAYTVELRDAGRFGFLLPAEHVDATGEEMFNAVRALTAAVWRQLRTRRRRVSSSSAAASSTTSAANSTSIFGAAAMRDCRRRRRRLL